MSGISGIPGATQVPMRPPVNSTAREGSPAEEAHESLAGKTQEQRAVAQTGAPPAPTAEGVGQAINLLA